MFEVGLSQDSVVGKRRSGSWHSFRKNDSTLGKTLGRRMNEPVEEQCLCTRDENENKTNSETPWVVSCLPLLLLSGITALAKPPYPQSRQTLKQRLYGKDNSSHECGGRANDGNTWSNRTPGTPKTPCRESILISCQRSDIAISNL